MLGFLSPFDWLWQGILGNLVSWLIIIGVTIMVGILKAKRPQWSGPVLYGLAGGAFAAIILLAMSALSALPKPQPQITPDNIESHIHAWADYFGLSVQRQSTEDSYFTLLITLPSSSQIAVCRPKAHDRYLQFQAAIIVSPEYAAILAKLPKAQADLIRRQLMLDLSRAKVGYTAIGNPLRTLLILKMLPITNNLDESTFLDQLADMDSALSVAIHSFAISLSRTGKESLSNIGLGRSQ
jgi:hypothetical protein